MFDQVSGYHGLAKLTRKVNNYSDCLELLRHNIQNFTKALVEKHIPVKTKMLNPFSHIFLATSRKHVMESVANVGKRFIGREAA